MTSRVDITLEVPDGQQVASIFLPPAGPQPRDVLICLPGGTYDRHYWHLGEPGYSFAERLAGRGHVVVALDHLGVGGSSNWAGGPLGLERMARNDEVAIAHIRAALNDGELAQRLPPLDLPFVGIGHSMGALLALIIQASSRPFEAVVLLGYSVIAARLPGAAHESVDTVERRLRADAGSPSDSHYGVVGREALRDFFHAPDVPARIVAADDLVMSRVPFHAIAELTQPGVATAFAQSVDVPVFLAFGDTDVSPEPQAEPACYPHSRDVTLVVLKGSHHCHNLSERRGDLWDLVAAWLLKVI